MRVEELVGQRIRTERDRLEMTQEQLGKRLSDKLGRSWSRQAVSAAEKGDRAFTAAELVAIASTLDISVGGLLMPPAGVDDVEMPNGTALSRQDLVAAVLPRLGTEKAFDRMQETLGRLNQLFQTIQWGTSAAEKEVQLLNDTLLLAQEVREGRDRLEDAD